MNDFDEAIAASFQKIDEGSKSVKIAMSSAVAPVSLRLEGMCAGVGDLLGRDAERDAKASAVARLGPNAPDRRHPPRGVNTARAPALD
jgi:hypothetical protein